MVVVREIALVVWLLGQMGPARASEGINPTRSWLQWSTSDPAVGCDDPAEFAAQVEKRLGRSPAAAAAELDLSINARIERLPGLPTRWTGELRVQSRDGTSHGGPHDRSCRRLLRTPDRDAGSDGGADPAAER